MSRSYYLQIIKDRNEDISKLKSEIKELEKGIINKGYTITMNKEAYDLIVARVKELEAWIRRYRYNIKQNKGDGTQRGISKLLGDPE